MGIVPFISLIYIYHFFVAINMIITCVQIILNYDDILYFCRFVDEMSLTNREFSLF